MHCTGTQLLMLVSCQCLPCSPLLHSPSLMGALGKVSVGTGLVYRNLGLRQVVGVCRLTAAEPGLIPQVPLHLPCFVPLCHGTSLRVTAAKQGVGRLL